MNPTLDCSSIETAVESLRDLLGLSRPKLMARVFGGEVDWHHPVIPPEQQVMIQLGMDPKMPPEPHAVRWFHATRAHPASTFEEGLLPTLQALPRLWEVLGECAGQWLSPSDWMKYRDTIGQADRHFARQFHAKRDYSGWDGPFAFLVRDAALHRHDGHKDFTRVSEAAEDICADFEEVFAHPLRKTYEMATCPCLVVFTWPGARDGYVQATANYVYRSLRGIECGFECNTNFSGDGKAVPNSRIDRVEWLAQGSTAA